MNKKSLNKLMIHDLIYYNLEKYAFKKMLHQWRISNLCIIFKEICFLKRKVEIVNITCKHYEQL